MPSYQILSARTSLDLNLFYRRHFFYEETIPIQDSTTDKGYICSYDYVHQTYEGLDYICISFRLLPGQRDWPRSLGSGGTIL